MRKLIWGVAACGVALAGGLLGAAYLAGGSPTSVAARCLTGLSRMTVLLNPTTGIAPVLAEKVWHSGTARGCEDLQECGGPEEFADPVPVEDPAIAPEPAEVREISERKPGTCIHAEFHLAPIVIPEDVPSTIDPDTLAAPESQCAPPAEGEPCRPSMPYCVEEDEQECEQAPMPAEVHHAQGCGHGHSCGKCHKGKSACCAEGDEDAEIEAWIEQFSADLKAEAQEGNEAQESDTPPACCPHSTYHHAPVCPYSGRSYQDMQCPHSAPKCQPAPGDDEPSQEGNRPKKHKRMKEEEEDSPTHFDVDTMEYRRSDGNLADYGPGAL